MRFVTDQGDIAAASLHAGCDKGGVVFAFETRDLDESGAEMETLDQERCRFTRTIERAVPDFGARERIVRLEERGEAAHLVAAARAERAGGVFGGGDGVRVTKEEESHAASWRDGARAQTERRRT